MQDGFISFRDEFNENGGYEIIEDRFDAAMKRAYQRGYADALEDRRSEKRSTDTPNITAFEWIEIKEGDDSVL